MQGSNDVIPPQVLVVEGLAASGADDGLNDNDEGKQ